MLAPNPPPATQHQQLQTLCERHYRPLHAHVCGKLPQRSDADDIVQETWLRVLRAATRGMLVNGRAYVYRVAHNLIVDHYRQRQRLPATVAEDDVLANVSDPRPGPQQRYLLIEQWRQLDAVVAALPPRSREVLMLARVEAMSLADIARQLGITRQTAHGHLLRALVQLQALEHD